MPLRLLPSRSEIRDRRLIALNVMALAFIVRAWWTLRVQSPFGAVYSDMDGYLSRAEHLLAHTTPLEPRILALWPWGTHVLVAMELALFHHAQRPIMIFHAFMGAIPAACAALLTARFIRSRAAMVMAGVVVALWHPHIVYSGFFSSEIWFTSLLWLLTLGVVWYCEGRRWAAPLAGVMLAAAFVVRPQILLTCMLIGVAMLVPRWRLRARGARRWSWGWSAALVVPLMIAMIASSVRLHQLTGRYGLIAAYEPMQRLFGETDVGKIEASWVTDKGVPYNYWFAPRTKQPVRPEQIVHMDGFIGDPDLLAAIHKERLRGVPRTTRARRMAQNVAFLATRNLPWPEDDFRADPRRRRLQEIFGRATLIMIPLAIYGLFCLRRHFVGQLIVWANLLTIIIVAAVYLGEARYRVPYDTFAIVAATVGLFRIGHAVLAGAMPQNGWRRLLRRRKTKVAEGTKDL